MRVEGSVSRHGVTGKEDGGSGARGKEGKMGCSPEALVMAAQGGVWGVRRL